ncbi:MAG: hypothetical protein ACFFD4_28280 [Candidatus Odinarchaeota archaeon]
MSETYINMFSEWEDLVELINRDKSLKRDDGTPLAAAFVLLARMISNFTTEQEYKLWRAMIKMFDTTKIKIDSIKEDKSLIAAVLLLTAEMSRTTKK